MQKIWCWRCGKVVPMLDEEEYKKAHELIGLGMRLDGPKEWDKRFKAVIDYHKEITGEEETNVNVIAHHRIALFGPPCESCGKPYRTNLASFCAACGNRRKNSRKSK